ncbi:DNA-binding transcriptional regulator, AcrR family [Micromonospora viridifaciens]|uniref:DNA-binding transcriptional regulator, AcrR family n=1 Tax=Micromonospora viridifaciens TaxID=1881 RepID=A0A1C4YLI0_MICVI|nr:TetR family transcriptional regulator C-terminal domain-containing protein [Micromonospora viridifaciens]SCF21201.1 DNA-binding transcriptional regulator, AcrR family [Micromonospora viridifaciens]
MPKIVDHDQRRRELAAAVWQVIACDGVEGISIRSVAAASGWSSGALRHYFSTRAELLAFACEQVIEQVTERIQGLRHTGDPVQAVRAILLQTMPVDETRRTEDSIAFAFLALGLGDPELARVQRRHFTGMYELCLRLVQDLAERNALAQSGQDVETLARRMHAVVDGLTVHALAGHLTAEEIVAQLDAYLADLTGAELT